MNAASKTLLLAAAVVAVLIMGTVAQAAPPHQAAAASAPAQAEQWRYVYHNNQWWYYMPNSTWMVHQGGQWMPYNVMVAQRPYRSYSVEPVDRGGRDDLYNLPLYLHPKSHDDRFRAR